MKLDALVEAILFCSNEPVPVGKLSDALQVSIEAVEEAVVTLDKLYSGREYTSRGLQVAFALQPNLNLARLSKKLSRKIPVPLSKGALETLAIIAYCQPVTRQDIQSIRGVNPEASLDTLLEKGLIRETGRKKTLGRPKLYGTTDEFLKKASLNSISDLPPLTSGPSQS